MRLPIILAVAAFALGPSSAGAASVQDCLRGFRSYDVAVLNFDGSTDLDDVALPMQVGRAAQRLRARDCVTHLDDLVALTRLRESLEGAVVGESGAPIRPIALQVGIVGGIFDEVQARDFFGRLGYRVRSQGAPGLGRRIYLGPFATEGGMAEAAEIARRAGFVAPYPRRF
jgi:hypothetical protein